MSSSLPYSPSRHWPSVARLQSARDAALAIARRIMRERLSSQPPQEGSKQAFGEAHIGGFHIALAEHDLRDALNDLPRGEFKALEVGAGMGWMSALLAARAPQGRFLMTEVAWSRDHNPLSPANQKQFRALCERDQPLADFFSTSDLSKLPSRLEMALATAEKLPVMDASIDFLFSINCQEHILDLEESWRENARVVKEGGWVFHTTEPLYFSAFGHHLRDIFPIPWGHLLWEAEEFAALVESEVGAQFHWAPNVPLKAEHLTEEVFASLNGATPQRLRNAIRSSGGWGIVGWIDFIDPLHRQWAKEIDIGAIVKGIDSEALLLEGLRMRLQRRESAPLIQIPLQLNALTRNRLRRILLR